MPHHVDPVHVENVPHSHRSDLGKSTKSRHETLNILTAKKNEKKENHENAILELRTSRTIAADQNNMVNSLKRQKHWIYTLWE